MSSSNNHYKKNDDDTGLYAHPSVEEEPQEE